MLWPSSKKNKNTNNMKRIIITLALFAAIIAPIAAQQKPSARVDPDQWMNRKDEQRKAYLIKQMGLNETERAAFEPLYDAYKAEMRRNRSAGRRAMKQVNDSSAREQIVKSLDTFNRLNVEQAQADQRFCEQLKKVLPAAKIYRYYEADKSFNKLMMKDLRPMREKLKN